MLHVSLEPIVVGCSEVPKPAGYAVLPRHHTAVAANVIQGRADLGVTLDTIARNAGLGVTSVQHEQYDFVTP